MCKTLIKCKSAPNVATMTMMKWDASLAMSALQQAGSKKRRLTSTKQVTFPNLHDMFAQVDDTYESFPVIAMPTDDDDESSSSSSSSEPDDQRKPPSWKLPTLSRKRVSPGSYAVRCESSPSVLLRSKSIRHNLADLASPTSSFSDCDSSPTPSECTSQFSILGGSVVVNPETLRPPA
jgi:hypothetical protein